MHPSTGQISPVQRRVLVVLKRLGEATADDLAKTLEISASAVRQHLSALRSAGYIDAEQQRGQPGRPADRFHTTELTEAMFVKDTSNLSIELLSHMEEEDPGLVTRVFERRRQRRVAETADKLAGKTLGEKVAVLAAELDAEGYLADFDQIDTTHFRINLHSCAMWAVASRYGQACATELDYLRELLPETTIERITHKAAGAHICAYEVSST
ncbi:MAG: ArsR family transcriptional regulator [Acidimicrobiaceae bacterium]|nr:ArsR family transcriptional regulator [Acidimicrobiaceae bacterium]MDA9241382.1 ArsR family transcriptional regulator [bacterium]HAY66964.1 transcriptional regulator [Acidimicrobiaceae bacterium]